MRLILNSAPVVHRTVLILALLLVSTGCRTVQSDLRRLADEPAEFTHIFHHDPAITLKIMPGQPAIPEGALAVVLSDESTLAGPWSTAETLSHIEGLFENMRSESFVDPTRYSWISLNTGLADDFIAGLDSHLPFSSATWPEALHLRVLLPTSSAPEDLEERALTWRPASGPIEVHTGVMVLNHYVVVDVLLVDEPLAMSRREELLRGLQAPTNQLETLRITPALADFLKSPSPLALYLRLDEVANLASIRRALAIRHEAFSSPGSLLTVRSWLVANRSLFRERDQLRHSDRRIEDLAVLFTSSGEARSAELRATRMKGQLPPRLTQPTRLPEPTTTDAFFAAEFDYDLPGGAFDRLLPFWSLSERGFSQHQLERQVIQGSSFGLLPILLSPSVLQHSLDLRGALPLAIRVRAYSLEVDGDEVRPRSALAAKFRDDPLVEALFRDFQGMHAARGESAEYRILPAEEGYLLVVYTRNMEIEEAFPDLDAETPVQNLAVHADWETTQQWFGSSRWLFPAGPLRALFTGDPPQVSVALASNDSTWAMNLAWGEEARAEEPALRAHRGELQEHTLSCRDSLLTVDRYLYRSLYAGSFLPDRPHRRMAQYNSLVNRLAQCEATSGVDQEGRASLHSILGAAYEEAFQFEAAQESYRSACAEGDAQGCDGEERVARTMESRPTPTPMAWDLTNNRPAECATTGVLSVVHGTLHFNGQPLGELGSDGMAELLQSNLGQGGPGTRAAVFRHYPETFQHVRRRVAVFADGETDTLLLLRLLHELQAADGAPMEFVAVTSSADAQRACLPLTLVAEAPEDPEPPLEVALSEAGFSLVEAGERRTPIMRCPEESPTICLRTAQVGLPPERRFQVDLPTSLRGYDFNTLFQLIERARAGEAGEEGLVPRISVAEPIPWEVFLKSADLLMQPGQELPWMSERSPYRSAPDPLMPRVEVLLR